ncbi:unnamed protein product [Rotaria sp. Silwood1]|nr:unnamed protein product [Rotaria sp. Silwood1]
MLAAGSVQGSALWWTRGHRAHHRYTDTDLDPYSAQKGLFHSHIGWLLMKPRRKPGFVDMSDLVRDPSVQWQSRHLLILNVVMGFALPCLVCGLGWGDYRGGYFYAAVLRLVLLHHATFSVNSLAHYLGDTTFDDKHTPRDHFLTAFVTLGEGYHNFHHEFPCDYRNGRKWFQYDPTKWAIWMFKKLGLAHNLNRFSENEILKGCYALSSASGTRTPVIDTNTTAFLATDINVRTTTATMDNVSKSNINSTNTSEASTTVTIGLISSSDVSTIITATKDNSFVNSNNEPTTSRTSAAKEATTTQQSSKLS